jgi:uncharacterized protein
MNNVLVLTDFKIGSSKQGIELAKKMNANYEILNIEYNRLTFLPNFLIGSSGIIIKNKSELELSLDQKYDIIISSGRRLAVTALFIKKIFLNKFNKNIKIIQILNPDINLNKFDVVISPIIERLDGQNVVKILGSINSIKEEIENNENIYFREEHKQNSIGVLVGGNTKNFKYTISDATKLCDRIDEIKKNASKEDMSKDMSVVITFSRRTPDILKNYIKNRFPLALIYDSEKSDANIYLGMLKYCKNIIVTLDSISMCSESLESNAFINIYAPKKILKGKYRRFIDYIYNNDLIYKHKVDIFW